MHSEKFTHRLASFEFVLGDKKTKPKKAETIDKMNTHKKPQRPHRMRKVDVSHIMCVWVCVFLDHVCCVDSVAERGSISS